MEQTHEMKNTSDSLLLFDPIVVVRDVLKNWLVIVLAALAVGVGSYILTDMEYAPCLVGLPSESIKLPRSATGNLYTNSDTAFIVGSPFAYVSTSSNLTRFLSLFACSTLDNCRLLCVFVLSPMSFVISFACITRTNTGFFIFSITSELTPCESSSNNSSL